ncbi:MAG: hypothetical protein ACE5JL_16960 [Dehalococcoidia bacterium]
MLILRNVGELTGCCGGLEITEMRRVRFENIHKYTQLIRDFVTEPRKQRTLLKNRPTWYQLCSSLDVIEDSALAIEAYSRLESAVEPGPKYLAVYGLLQALVLQQDAVRYLCAALALEDIVGQYPRLREIRQVRHDVAGHPTKRGPQKGRPESYHAVSRVTLGPGGFQLLSNYSDGHSKIRHINVPKLIQDQEQCVTHALHRVVELLGVEVAAHKAKFRGEKLVECFPEAWAYYASKLAEGAYNRDKVHARGALASAESLADMLDAFRQTLAGRGIELDTYDSVKLLYDELEYPLMELKSFFEALTQGKESEIDHRAMYIFAWYVKAKVGELRDIAEEIDAEYAK